MSANIGERLDAAVATVVDNGNCSGCGACTLLDSGIAMGLASNGYSRPSRVSASTAATDAVSRFEAACPGVTVRAQNPAGAVRHPTMGPVVHAWEAWASDPEIRYTGSSGGTLTALSTWLLETGEASATIGASSEAARPTRTVSLQLTTKEAALAAAGSRYAPTSNAAVPG